MGIPTEWFIFSLLLMIGTVYPFSFLGFFLGFFAVSLMGRYLALYYDHQFAKVFSIKLSTLSFNSYRYHYYKKTKLKTTGLGDIISIFGESIKFNLSKNEMMKNFFNKTNRISKYFPKFNFRLQDFFNIKNLNLITISHVEEEFLYHKNGSITAIVEIQGVDSTIDSEGEETQYNTKVNVFNSLPNDIIASYYVIRKPQRLNLKNLEENIITTNPTAKAINSQWLESFNLEYQNKYYIFLTTKKPIINIKSGQKENKKSKLVEICNSYLNSLQKYEPRRITKPNEISKIVSELYGSFPCDSSDDKKKIDVDPLLNNPFKINDYAISSSGEYSTFINVKAFLSNQISSSAFKLLSQLNSKILFYMHWENYPNQIIKEKINKKLRRVKATEKDADNILEEYQEVKNLLEAGEEKIVTFNMGLRVFGDSLSEIKQNIANVFELLQKYNIQPQDEKGVFLGYFYAIMPSGVNYHPRKLFISTKNVATMLAPTKSEKGLEKSAFGNTPISRFYTIHSGVYKFNFHADDSIDANGHTIVIGTTGSGKTTFVNFLMSQSLKYDDIKIFAFDQKDGQYIFFKAHEGDYKTLEIEGMDINPFSLENTGENTVFVNHFLKTMVNAKEEDELQISETTTRIMKLKEKNLLEYSKIFAKMHTKIRDKIDEWIDGGYKGHFDGKQTIDFKRMTCFNMTAIMRDERLRSLYSYYFYHQFMQQHKGKKGIIFFDELKSFIGTPIGELAETLSEQARKDGKIIIGAYQNIQQIDNPMGRAIMNNVATLVMFPIGKSLGEYERDLYKERGLNDTEISFLEQNPPNCRMALIKKDKYSVIIHTNLQYLEKYAKVFNSNQSEVEILKKIINRK